MIPSLSAPAPAPLPTHRPAGGFDQVAVEDVSKNNPPARYDTTRHNAAGSDSVKLQLMLKTIPGTRKGNDSSVSKKETNKTLPGQQQQQQLPEVMRASEGTSTKVLMGANISPKRGPLTPGIMAVVAD